MKTGSMCVLYAATMFATVSDILPATVGADSEVLIGGGQDVGKLIGKRSGKLA